jgi:Putative peptidoglycan binding domain
MQALGRNVPLSETQTNVFGLSTAAVLKALQADLGIPATGVVDTTAVAVINKALASRATDQRNVRGRVIDADGNPRQGPLRPTLSAAAGGRAGNRHVGAGRRRRLPDRLSPSG